MNSDDSNKFDFEHPSTLFILEDKLKVFLGGPLLYKPYYKTFEIKGDENILDFGCGGGAGSIHLARSLVKGGRLTCLDISSYWMDIAARRLKKYSNVECKTGDIRSLDIPDSSFDILSVIHVIHDIDKHERQSTAKALSRKLKQEGYLFIREPVKASHGMPADEIRALFNAVGLNEIDSSETKAEYQGKYSKAEWYANKNLMHNGNC